MLSAGIAEYYNPALLDTHIWDVGYRLTRLDKPVSRAVPNHLLTEFGINHIGELWTFFNSSLHSHMLLVSRK